MSIQYIQSDTSQYSRIDSRSTGHTVSSHPAHKPHNPAHAQVRVTLDDRSTVYSVHCLSSPIDSTAFVARSVSVCLSAPRSPNSSRSTVNTGGRSRSFLRTQAALARGRASPIYHRADRKSPHASRGPSHLPLIATWMCATCTRIPMLKSNVVVAQPAVNTRSSMSISSTSQALLPSPPSSTSATSSRKPQCYIHTSWPSDDAFPRQGPPPRAV